MEVAHHVDADVAPKEEAAKVEHEAKTANERQDSISFVLLFLLFLVFDLHLVVNVDDLVRTLMTHLNLSLQ